ncbi:MAG: acetylxylan esterase [Candidatus Glassbacteria bacterium]
MRTLRAFLAAFLMLAVWTGPAGAEETDIYKVLPVEDEFADQSIMLLKHLSRQTQERNWQREVEVARIRDEHDWNAYKERLLRDYRTVLGLPFPERTPLNAEIFRSIDRGGYRIENVIYESTPGILVTANLYVPQQGNPPYPAILFPCGHWHEGKAAGEYHSAALGLVQKGFVVLLFDPVGQGERCDYFKEDGSLVTEQPVIEHTLLANPLFLMGKHLMAVRMWDAVRGIDYLVSRPEVDSTRIGCTGNSGGGTETVHLVPLDERIKAAVPDGTVDSPELGLGGLGIGDGEQNRPRMVPYAITMADLMMLAWPRPYRLIIESREGVRRGTLASFTQARFLYRTLGHAERMSLVETEWPHGFFKFSREKMYQWFDLWFYGRQDGWEEPELKLEKQQDLWCTATGNIVRERGKSVQQWTAGQARRILPRPEAPSDDVQFEAFRAKLSAEIRELLDNPAREDLPVVKPLGSKSEVGLTVEKLALYSESDVYLPCLYFKPSGKTVTPAVILADPRGKTADGGKLAQGLAALGYGVLAVDLRGYGETRVTASNSERDGVGGLMAQTLGVQASIAYDGLKLGRSIFAMRVFDLGACLDYLYSRPDVDRDRGVALIGRSSCGPQALYAAALDSRVKGVLADSSLVSFSELTRPGLYTWHFIDFLPRVLASHDLFHVAGSLAPRAFTSLDPLDKNGRLVDTKQALEQYDFASKCYRNRKAAGKFQVRAYTSAEDRLKLTVQWVESVL